MVSHNTSMHSSRMRTARLLTRSRGGDGLHPRGSASQRGLHPWGVCIQGSAPQGFLHPRGVCIWGSASRGVCIWGVGQTPSPCEQTDRCKNITLPKTSFAGGKKQTEVVMHFGRETSLYLEQVFPP